MAMIIKVSLSGMAALYIQFKSHGVCIRGVFSICVCNDVLCVCVSEKKQNDEFVGLYVSEEERILNCADLWVPQTTPIARRSAVVIAELVYLLFSNVCCRSAEERSDVLAELVYSRSRLKQLNSELQRTVELADDNNTVLRTENAALRNQVKG